MSRHLVDTDVLVDFLRGYEEAVEWIGARDAPPLVSVITIAELHAGLRPGEEAMLDTMIEACETVSIDSRIARVGGNLRHEFGPSHGTGLADALIAACALEANATLVTLNARHFPMVERLHVPYARR